MRAVALSLGAIMSVGPVLLAGTAISADRKATERRVTSVEIVTAPPEEPLFYGGILRPITIEARRTSMIQARQGVHRATRCTSEPA